MAMLSALLAYPLFRLSGSQDIGFYRSLVSRGGQALILLSVYPLAKWLGLCWSDFGLKRRFLGQWLIGFLLGSAMLGLHMIALVMLDVRIIAWEKFNPHELLPILGKSLAIGFGVALLEESIFRGALLSIIRRLSNPTMAIVVSAFYYAVLHFIGSKWTTDSEFIGWDTGFRIALDGFAHLREVAPDSFLGLFVAGLFLGSLRVVLPMSLGLCMGIHAGWVFIIKSYKSVSYLNFDSSLIYLVSHYDLIIGYLSAAWLSVFVILMWIAVAVYRKHLPGLVKKDS
jgi:membrane protease YdiL (CAAX protease family)